MRQSVLHRPGARWPQTSGRALCFYLAKPPTIPFLGQVARYGAIRVYIYQINVLRLNDPVELRKRGVMLI